MVADADANASARIEIARAQSRVHVDLTRILRERVGKEGARSFFLALADIARPLQQSPSPSKRDCRLIEAGRAFFVRYTKRYVRPANHEVDLVTVNGKFEVRHGLPLFAQLLMNGAADLHAKDEVIAVFKACRAGAVIDTEKAASALAAGERAAPDLFQLWEPPHFAGRVLRFCYDDHRGHFGAITVDTETCAVASEERCKAPVHYLVGRAYSDGDRPTASVTAGLVYKR